MRVLLLTHSFNGLAQRLHLELSEWGHQVSVEFDISDTVTLEAVALFRPHLVVAPYLRRAIPEAVWGATPCLIVHPGPPGDRGPSALDWAVQESLSSWGVTVLQAEAGMDAGPVWGHAEFLMRPAAKSSLYRFEVTEAAVQAVREAVQKIERGGFTPVRQAGTGHLRPLIRQGDRAFDWACDDAVAILRRLRAADGWPGVRSTLFGEPCHLYDPWPGTGRMSGPPGEVIARRGEALLVTTVDGGFWIGQVKRPGGCKLPATLAFAEAAGCVPAAPALAAWWEARPSTWQDIGYREAGRVGFLRFDAPGGALHTGLCRRLLEAYRWAAERPTHVIVLEGGAEFWCNGIHLNVIEAAESPADESWANIQALDDLAEAILRTDSHLTVAALGANAGAGGCFLARAADEVWVREGVILNPHYKNMGNLYGSEFWTYLLPPRVGEEGAKAIMQRRLPMGAREAVTMGFYDAVLGGDRADFSAQVAARAAALSAEEFTVRLASKRTKRALDEAAKPLAVWRTEELEHLRRNFYGFDSSYHVSRSRFVRKDPHSWTPRHLAKHRELGWEIPEE
jgi:putative two-component system hydrogenase maturation factor HypX/HoxX